MALVAMSIAVGAGVARVCGFDRETGLIAACASSICGGSAALAVAAVVDREGRVLPAKCAIIAMAALLSTLAMFVYPPLLQGMGLGDQAIGIVLGASIQDLPLAVSAGYSVSDHAGEIATLVKLARVACLLPVLLAVSLWSGKRLSGQAETDRKALLPGFMLAFLALILVNSFLTVPPRLAEVLADVSRWSLIVAVAATGVQASMRHIVLGSGRLIALLLFQAAAILGLALVGVLVIGR